MPYSLEGSYIGKLEIGYLSLSNHGIAQRFDEIGKIHDINDCRLGDDSGWTKSRLSIVKKGDYGTSGDKAKRTLKDFSTYFYWREELRATVYHYDLQMILQLSSWMVGHKVGFRSIAEQIIRNRDNYTNLIKDPKKDYGAATLAAHSTRTSFSIEAIVEDLQAYIGLVLPIPLRHLYDVYLGSGSINDNSGNPFSFDKPLFKSKLYQSSKSGYRPRSSDGLLDLSETRNWTLSEYLEYYNKVKPQLSVLQTAKNFTLNRTKGEYDVKMPDGASVYAQKAYQPMNLLPKPFIVPAVPTLRRKPNKANTIANNIINNNNNTTTNSTPAIEVITHKQQPLKKTQPITSGILFQPFDKWINKQSSSDNVQFPVSSFHQTLESFTLPKSNAISFPPSLVMPNTNNNINNNNNRSNNAPVTFPMSTIQFPYSIPQLPNLLPVTPSFYIPQHSH
jgi:hypothetical protein